LNSMLKTAEMYPTVPRSNPLRTGVRYCASQHANAIVRFEQCHY
jgi:hypothetical protein